MNAMTRKSALLLLGLCAVPLAFAQAPPVEGAGAMETFPLRTLQQNAFQAGERLDFIVHYGFMNAGEATVELQATDRKIQGRPMLHAVGTGRSLGAFDLFYKVDDRYETWFDKKGVFPWVFQRRVSEGGYEFSQDYLYMQHRRQVSTQKERTHDVPADVQDMLSAFYYARTLDLRHAEPGQVFEIQTFLDDEIWPLRMKFVGRETIKVRSGRYQCLRFQPVVQEGRIFATNDDLNVWVTDDGNLVPVLAQAKVLVGSIKMELAGYSGLVHPIAKL